MRSLSHPQPHQTENGHQGKIHVDGHGNYNPIVGEGGIGKTEEKKQV